MYTKHAERGILRLSGKDAKDLLQTTLTQNISLLKEDTLSYSALLTPQGKFLYDFFISLNEEMYWIECKKEHIIPLAQELHKYVISKEVIFEDLSEDITVYTTEETTAETKADPRNPQMPNRLWVSKNSPLPKKEEISIDTSTYTKKRISLKVPENDGIPGKTLLNELDFEKINGVSFEKGCYVGQELTARTKFRTKPNKKLYKVNLSTLKTIPANTPLLNKSNTEVGWIFSNLNGKGIALIKERHKEEELFLPSGETVYILPEED